MLYRVSWSIEVDADSPREAAELCRTIMRDPDNIAVVFEVVDEDGNRLLVDLLP